MHTRISGIVLFLLAGSFLMGCGEAGPTTERVPVSGEVTLDGQPLDKGVIYFKTVAEGSIDTLEIQNGKFSGQTEPGNRRVEIAAFRPAQGGTPGMDSGEVNYLPAKYHANSALTAEVTESGPNEFSFEVTTK